MYLSFFWNGIALLSYPVVLISQSDICISLNLEEPQPIAGVKHEPKLQVQGFVHNGL